MNTVTKALEKLKDSQSLVYELVDQRNSGYTMKNTINSANPIHLRSSKKNVITVTSEVCLGKSKGYTQIQYVPNQPVINVDDVYVDKEGYFHSMAEDQQPGWEKLNGLKTRLGEKRLEQEYNNAKKLGIGFSFGLLSVDTYGGDPTLLAYLDNHHLNEGRPNAKFDTKKHVGLFKFRRVEEEKKAAQKLDILDVKVDALNYVNSLRIKKGEGGYTYSAYNKKKIDATLRILDLNPGCAPEEFGSKHLLLMQYAEANPVQFMGFLEDAFNQYSVEIGKAVSYDVLKLNKKDASLMVKVEGQKPEPRLIITFTETTEKNCREELAVHFMTDAGITDYKQMCTLVGVAGRGSN